MRFGATCRVGASQLSSAATAGPTGVAQCGHICQSDSSGWPHDSQADIARAWKHVLGRVSSFADLEPALLGRVEELIDFTTQP